MKRKTIERKKDISKKANAFTDTFTVLAIVIVVAITSIVGYMIYREMATAFSEDTTLDSDVTAEVNTVSLRYGSIMDNVVVFLLVVAWIASLIFSFLVDAHPVFLIISLIFLIVIFIVAASVANAFTDFADDPGVSEYSQDFPKTRFIADNLVIFVVLIGASVMIVLYGKQQ